MASQQNVSKSSRPISFVGMNVNQVKSELAAQLSNQEQLLAKLGTSQISRNAFLKQSDMIRKELQDLNKYNQQDELPTEIREKLETLANEFQHIKATKSSDTVSPLLPPAPTHSSSSKQRAKYANGNKRNPDIEFATEIGQGLLIEVRKLQSIIQEKEEIIKQLEAAKRENERHHETAQRHLKQREEIEERLKEENWNLEVANQELRTHLLESNQTIAKHNAEYARLVKQIKNQSEQIDIMKAQEEKNTSLIEAMKARHEQETHQLRKHAANAQRENAQIQKQIEALNTELKICKAKLAIKMATASARSEEPSESSEAAADKNDQDSDHSVKDVHPTSSTSTTTNRSQQLETETLKQSLAHAHRIISNLRSTAHKEKLEKFELKKMLSDSQETIEQLRKDIANMSNNAISINGSRSNTKTAKKKHTKKRRGGVARQARGVSINDSSDSDQQSIKSSDSELDDSMDEQQDPQFNNGLGLGFGMPISALPMKPLSSELEFKVQVIDVGINTDPIDIVAHEKPSDSLSSVSLSTHSVAPVTSNGKAVDVTTVPQLSETSFITDAREVTLEHTTDNQPSLDTNDIPKTAEKPQVIVQEQIKHVVLRELQTASARAAIILPQEQMTLLIKEKVFVPTESSFSQLPTLDSHQQTSINVDPTADVQPRADLISLEEAKKMVKEALEKSQVEVQQTMISKTEVDKLITEALEKSAAATKQDMVPKAAVDQLIAEAIEKAVLSEREEMQSRMIEREKVEEMMKTMVERQEVEEMMKTMVEREKVEEMMKTMVEREKVEEMMKTMVPRSTVDQLIAKATEEAIQLEQQKRADEVSGYLVQPSRQQDEEIITKRQADMLVYEAVENAISAERQRVAAEKDNEPSRKDTKPRIVFSEGHESVIDIAPTDHHEAAEKQLTEIKSIHISEQSAIAEEKENEPKEDMIAQSQVDKLIAEATEKALLLERQKISSTMVLKEEAEKMAVEASTKALEEAKREMQKKIDQDMISKSNVDTLIEQAKQSVRAELDVILKEAQIAATKDMITKSEAETMALEAVEKERSNMISKEEAQGLVTQAVAKETERLLNEHQQALETALAEAEAAKSAEKESLLKTIESYKKECDDLNQRMKHMLTKDSTDVLIKRAVADALKTAEKKQKEMLANMISKVDADILIQQAVSRALEQERKEVAEREATETVEMISKAEAEALAKVAAADAIVKERQAQAAREKELITKEEADTLLQQAVREAVEKEKLEHAETLAKERKAMKEKEENLITKEQAETMVAEAVHNALEKEKKARAEQNTKPNTSVPSKHSQLSHSPLAIERSISTSRLAPPSSQVSPSPSVSTPPATSRHKLRLSSSVSSLRRKASADHGSSKKEPHSRQSTESHRNFGTLRIFESTTYGSRKLSSRSNLRNIANQESATSISTISSEDAQPYLPPSARSDDNLAAFANHEGTTDLEVITAITKTMIGEWLLKHTRRYVGGGISENKHRRFFWVHPYTKTLYWSSIEPGIDGSESKAKSAFIEAVVQVPSNNNQEASPMSLLIRTPKRDLKLTAPTLERHEIWFKSLSYLLGRSTHAHPSTEESPTEESQYNNTMQSIKSMIPIHDVTQYDSDDSEDIVNIRQCCDGKHDVSTLSKKHSHTHL
ncbi:hypothetical protein G6F70_005024 [Rhizopus microsporus]|nr:hypothetical protein G6F71_004599 [Rhizopus microsporus]KAG1199321.1 hypothetical protein G6F70_005024 [Rhizopus microsporus]KAG1211135.1 hypothetical protein G6F69_004851 [Rhizopus microsporus]